MKKILAGIIAITTVFCTFTGCGSTDEKKSDGNDTSVETTTESEEDTEETFETETEDNEDSDEKQIENVVKEYFDAMYSGDSKKLMELQVPDGCTDVLDLKNICIYTEDDDDIGINTPVEDYVKEIIKYYPKGKFVKVSESLNLYGIEEDVAKKSISGYILLEDYIKEHGGVDNVDPEEIAAYLNENNTDEAISSLKFDVIKNVCVDFLEDGEEKPSEKEFVVYRVNGGNLHILEPFYSFLDYNLISEADNSARFATNLHKSAEVSLIEFIEEFACSFEDEKFLFMYVDKMMICSDDSKNINVPESFDTDYFKEKMNRFFNEKERDSRDFKKLSDFDWFIVVGDDEVIYSVIVPKNGSKVITYPQDQILNAELTTSDSENVCSMSFDEIYNACADIVKY